MLTRGLKQSCGVDCRGQGQTPEEGTSCLSTAGSQKASPGGSKCQGTGGSQVSPGFIPEHQLTTREGLKEPQSKCSAFPY